MTLQIALVLGIAALSMFLIMTERLRMDIVAILVLVSLYLLGLVKTPEALSGFSNQATITIIAMFILAAGLQNTGALSGVGQLLSKSKTPTSFLRSEERRVGKECRSRRGGGEGRELKQRR